MSDELLVVRCQLGERDAFNELVRAWHDRVWAYTTRMLGPADTADVAQDIWLAVFRGLPKLRQPDRFAPWLYAIARRAIVNRLRVEYARAEAAGEAEPAQPDTVDAVVDRTDLLAGLAGLPAPEREVLLLFYLEDLPADVCAEICAIPVGTVKSRLHRGRRMLRDELRRKGYQR